MVRYGTVWYGMVRVGYAMHACVSMMMNITYVRLKCLCVCNDMYKYKYLPCLSKEV